MSIDCNPLRRKIGVVTLVMACVFAAGWVRSVDEADQFGLPIGQDTDVELTSAYQVVFFRVGSVGYQTWYQPGWRIEAAFVDPFRPENLYEKVHMSKDRDQVLSNTFRWQQFGYRRTRLKDFAQTEAAFVSTPYWAIVIPLTVLSAWLLLSKPGSKCELPTIAVTVLP